MIALISLDSDLKPYGFVRLDYGRTWTNGNVAFIGGRFTTLHTPTESDFEAVARLYKDEMITFMEGKNEARSKL